jgi:hypothetical protein
MRRISLCFCLGFAALVGGCASHPGAAGAGDDLDVAMGDHDKAKPAPVTYADVVPRKGATADAKLPKTAVTNWQAFFKPPPSEKERHLLEERLAAWQDTSSPKDLAVKGRDEEALGRYAAAEADFRKALRLKADDLDAALELAALFLRKKSVGDAFDFLAQVKEGMRASRPPTMSGRALFSNTVILWPSPISPAATGPRGIRY